MHDFVPFNLRRRFLERVLSSGAACRPQRDHRLHIVAPRVLASDFGHEDPVTFGGHERERELAAQAVNGRAILRRGADDEIHPETSTASVPADAVFAVPSLRCRLTPTAGVVRRRASKGSLATL